MTCAVCKGKFADQDWGSPAEPCDCGCCLTERDLRDRPEVNLQALRDEWERDRRAAKLATAMVDTHRRYQSGCMERVTYKTHVRALWARAEDAHVARQVRVYVAEALAVPR